MGKRKKKQPKVISSAELMNMIKSNDIKDKALKKYFILDKSQQKGLRPRLIVNSALIKDDGRKRLSF